MLADIEKLHSSGENIEQKVMHNDMTKSNLLFKDGNFVSFIDTDAVGLGYIGRDFAELIVSSVIRYPFYKNKKAFIKEWYRLIDERFHLAKAEYIYGMDIYFLYRLQKRLERYRSKITFCKFLNFLEFISLRNMVLEVIRCL